MRTRSGDFDVLAELLDDLASNQVVGQLLGSRGTVIREKVDVRGIAEHPVPRMARNFLEYAYLDHSIDQSIRCREADGERFGFRIDRYERMRKQGLVKPQCIARDATQPLDDVTSVPFS